MSARPDVVERLTEALLVALTLQDATLDPPPTPSEMFSATLTLTSRFMKTLIALGMSPDEAKVGLNMIASEIPSTTRTIH